ncbi:MAG: NAD(+)/NADH kinase [bacterium]
MGRKRICVFANARKKGATEIVRELKIWGEKRNCDIAIEMDVAENLECARKFRSGGLPAADFVVVLGGDGTLLHTAAIEGISEIPIIAVNLGGLGFLTEINVGKMFDTLNRVLAEDYELDERMMIESTVSRGREIVASFSALNDIVAIKDYTSNVISFNATMGKEHIASYTADGLIVSTPTGSTAYSLSAGGPIVYPSLDIIILTPICPHTLTARPLILPADGTLSVEVSSKHNRITLTIDGQTHFPLENGDTIIVRKSERRIKLVKPRGSSYFDVLKAKLKWGDIDRRAGEL